jgi:hypothetical protein
MKLSRKQGATSQILQIFIQDVASVNGVGISGLTNLTPNLVAYYNKDTSPAPIQIPLARMVCGTYTASGFKEINPGKMQGWYQFCPPDVCFVSGCTVGIHIAGAAIMVPLPIEIDVAGYAKADVVSWSGTVLQPPTTPGIPDVYRVMENILGYVNVSGIQSVVASGLANTILSQSMKCVENTAGSGTLCELVLQSTNSSISSTTMHIKRSDGSDFSTKILVLEGGANPIRAIS